MRLAGTWSRYSNSAMPQLTSAATYQGELARFFRCPYHAKVMNRLDTASINAVTSSGCEIRFILLFFQPTFEQRVEKRSERSRDKARKDEEAEFTQEFITS